MRRLSYHDRDYIIPTSRVAIDLAKDEVLQSAEVTQYERTYNPYYFEPANDGVIQDIRTTSEIARILSQLGAARGDIVYATNNGTLLSELPASQSELQAATDEDMTFSVGSSVYSLESTGVAKTTMKSLHDGSTKFMERGWYREIELLKDPEPFILPEMLDDDRPDGRSASFVEHLKKIQRYKAETAIAAVGVSAAAVGYLEALSSPLDIVRTPMAIIGSFAVFKASNRPFKRYTALERDYLYAEQAAQWWHDQQAKAAAKGQSA